jgi:hypothetical protein
MAVRNFTNWSVYRLDCHRRKETELPFMRPFKVWSDFLGRAYIDPSQSSLWWQGVIFY